MRVRGAAADVSQAAKRACPGKLFIIAPMWDAKANENAQSRTRDPGGMTFAVKSDVHFNPGRDEAFWMLRAGALTGLDSADRQALSDWLDSASGIDTVVDFAVRPWNIAGASVIFGIFEDNKDKASWLVVRHGSAWTLARCADGFISDVSASLPDILDLIDEYRGA